MIDLHTHLYPEGDQRYLSGLNHLLNYHYVLGEFYKYSGMLKSEIERFNCKSIDERSEEIWDALIRPHLNQGFLHIEYGYPAPVVSEHIMGIVTCFHRLVFNGSCAFVDPSYEQDYSYSKALEVYPNLSLDELMSKAEISQVVATYDAGEEFSEDSMVVPSVRMNTYRDFSITVDSRALYYSYSCESKDLSRITSSPVLNELTDLRKPFWVMLGVKRRVTPYMGLGGDSIGDCSILDLIKFANAHPELKIPFSVLDSSKIHEAIVASRVTPNLFFAGHWWYNNIPTTIKQTMTTAVELIGASNFIHYYSDARVADQLIYKWAHFRQYKTELGYELDFSDGWLREKIFGARKL